MKVSEVRMALGWPVSELAKRSGLSEKTIRRIEGGESVYDFTFMRIVLAFNGSGFLKAAIGRERVAPEDFEEFARVRRR